MSDITISGGTVVSTEWLFVAHDRLASSGTELAGLAEALRPALALTEAPDAARLAHLAAAGIRAAAAEAARLAADVLEAARRYGAAEGDARTRIADLSTLAGWAFGRLAPLAAALALPELLAAAALALGAGSIAAGSPRAFLHDLGGTARSKARLLRDPRVVALIRFAVSGADDAMLGAAGVPLPVAALVDDRATGAFGLHGGASVVVAAGRTIGLLEETPVRVERVAAVAAAPPAGFSDLVDRIPPGRRDGPQVRIERYPTADGRPTYIVYVGGTVDTSPVAAHEPFDVTSDLVGVAQRDPASLAATEQAMREAGIRTGDTVIPVGYSQGGIVATSIATSGRFDTPTLVTFGSPTAGVDVPASTLDVAVEHTDDLVPALGGMPRGPDAHGGDRIVVARQTFSGEVPPDASPIDAHRIAEYAITAEKMDASEDPRLGSALAALPQTGSGDALLYRGVRVQPEPAR